VRARLTRPVDQHARRRDGQVAAAVAPVVANRIEQHVRRAADGDRLRIEADRVDEAAAHEAAGDCPAGSGRTPPRRAPAAARPSRARRLRCGPRRTCRLRCRP
jgi:hypothetical protein